MGCTFLIQQLKDQNYPQSVIVCVLNMGSLFLPSFTQHLFAFGIISKSWHNIKEKVYMLDTNAGYCIEDT